jgi:uncharacterized protein
MLPHTLKNLMLFADGDSYQGQVAKLTPPELTRKTEEFRAAGMDGPVEIDLGQEAMSMEWEAAGILDALFDHYGAPVHDAGQLRLRGSYESDENGSVRAVEIVLRGRHKVVALGEWTPGENNRISVTTAVSYLKISIDSAEKLEIDQAGMVFRVNGSDRLAARRAALGL